MLKTIEIQNVALIDKIEVDFLKGFNVLSGETGAGKSIIIDAINFVIGGKASKNLIKQNCQFMKVQAVFSVPDNIELKEILKSIDIIEDEIVILRKMQTDGRVDTKINGFSVSVATLKTITSFLIDIHGQHEHQKILLDKNHLQIIDGFISNKNLKENYKKVYLEYKEIVKEIDNLKNSTENQERILDLYSYQIDEIESAKIKPQEDEILKEKKLLMQNSEKIYEMLNSAYDCIDGSDSIIDRIKKSNNFVSNLTKYGDVYEKISQRIESCKFEMMDIASQIKDELYNCDFDKTEFDLIDERLDKIKSIKRKYGQTLEDVFKYLEKIKKEYNFVLNSKDKLKELNLEKDKILSILNQYAKKLSDERRNVAKKFEFNVKKELYDLGMMGSKFVVEFQQDVSNEEQIKFDENGCDKIKFMFSANKGQNLKPLSEIISGGEASRFMLAIKNILADYDEMPTMIFDEIDTGISGEMGYMVACKMANISKNHQIMAVSHLPQICAMADENIKISKTSSENDTFVKVEILNSSEAIDEIARLSGGVKDSFASKEHARQLKNRCDEYKKSL